MTDISENPANSGGGGGFPTAATEADILSCFRLLLGRRPSEQEWAGHAFRVGEDLGLVVASYLNSKEFADRHLFNRQAGSWNLVQLPHCKMYVSQEDTYIGKIILETLGYEPQVSSVFKEYLQPGMRVLDIGANVGYFTLLAASLVGPEGSVQSWEPSPSNVRALYASRMVNNFSNIEVIQAAAMEKRGLLTYYPSCSNGNVGKVGSGMVEDMLFAETVMGLTIDAVVSSDSRIDFVKIDAEGAEFKALQGGIKTLRRCRPLLVSEFSPPILEQVSGVSGREYLEFLTGLGYDPLVLSDAGPQAGDVNFVLEQFERSGTDHIDLLLKPKPRRRAWSRFLNPDTN